MKSPGTSTLLKRLMPGSRLRTCVILLGALVIGAGLLGQFAPADVGYDYEIFHSVGIKLLQGQPIYNEDVQSDGRPYRLLYLPHVAILLEPLSLLPARMGWALLCSASILAIILAARHWKLDPIQIVLCLTAIPTLRSLYAGNIDGLVMATVLLPVQWQIVGALAKPQVAIGLAARSLRHKGAWILLAALIALALAFRFEDSLPYLRVAQAMNLNVWHAINPWQLVAGGVLLAFGLWRNDDRLLMASSPFLSPYVTLGSLIPIWMAVSAFTNRWVSLTLWAATWIAVGWGIVPLV